MTKKLKSRGPVHNTGTDPITTSQCKYNYLNANKMWQLFCLSHLLQKISVERMGRKNVQKQRPHNDTI